MVMEKGKIQVGARGLQLLAKQAIDSLDKGLIELLTNADESYSRLEKRGQVVSGKIEIVIDRHTRTKPTVIEVIDYAEGMDSEEMKKCITEYGEDTSRGGGRGVFGMGLKDTLIAFGTGEVISFKHGKKWQCNVAADGNYEIKQPKQISIADLKDFPNHEAGTAVRTHIRPGQLKIGQFDTLKGNLQTHVCLRTIMCDPKRTIILKETGEEGQDLSYCAPAGDLIRDEELNIVGYPDAKATLKVYVAKGSDALSQLSVYRTGGIIITSFRACHEATLFGFDEDQYAAKLFGELRCNKIDELQRSGEQVVTKERDGLRKQHPFTQALFKAGKAVIEQIVLAEKKKAEQQQKVLETEETKKRFKDAVKSLNAIATKELEGAPGLGHGDDTKPPGKPRLPVNGFEFIPDSYRVVITEKETLKLRILLTPESGIKIGDLITIESNIDGVKILQPTTAVPVERYEDPAIAIASVGVEGVQPNAEAWITARCNGKEANATVDVVSTKVQRDPPSGGLFKEIKYKADNESPLRVQFDRQTGIIWINTVEPSVQLYFGPDGMGQDQAQNQCLVAELVTQVACEEIARERRAKGKLDIPVGVKELEAFYNYLNKLRIQNAGAIHKLLVNPKYRREF
jgi:hypothetical protein